VLSRAVTAVKGVDSDVSDAAFEGWRYGPEMKGRPPEDEGVNGDAERFENKRWSDGFFSLRMGEDGEAGAEPLGELWSDFGGKFASERLGNDKVGIGRVEESGVTGVVPGIVGNCMGEPMGLLIAGRRGDRLK